MSVAAARGAVSTQQATQEQIRLAQLIDDTKHDHPEVQEIIQRVLDVVAFSNQDDALLALFDCDYDYEKAVALLIEKGHDVASEWRTATNHKLSKKQKASGAARNGHEGDPDENGQQRYNDGFTYRGKSRGGRGKFYQQSNGGDSQNNQQPNDNYVSQQRSRGPGGGAGYRGRPRGNNRGGRGGHDRNYLSQQHQQQDPTADSSAPSDTAQQMTDGSNSQRRGGSNAGARQQPEQQWDVGNWNGETLIYSRTTKEEEEEQQQKQQLTDAGPNGIPNSSNALAGVANGQSLSAGVSLTKNVSEPNAQQKGQSEFDPVEAARQIKNVIGIGPTQQQKQSGASAPKSLMGLKSTGSEQSTGQQVKSKGTGQNSSAKATPSPSSMQRIPQQPVVFSDRFNGGLSKIDVQFGNLGELFGDTNPSSSVPAGAQKASVPASTAFHPSSGSGSSTTKLNNPPSALSNSARPTNLTNHPSSDQSSFTSPTASSSSTRPSDQVPVINQQRILPIQLQQQQQQQQAAMTMKPVVPSNYAVHQQQGVMNPPNMVMHSLFLHHHQHQQQEPVTLDTSYDPNAFQLQSADFNTPYYMTTALNAAAAAASHQQAQQRYLVPQSVSGPAQIGNTRPASTGNVQTSSTPTSSAASTVSTATPSTATSKKGPAVPPGIFLPSTPAAYSAAYSAPYGVPISVGGQQPTGAPAYPALFDAEHAFTNTFLQYTNPQQAQSPSGTYGSATPPIQQNQQQSHNSTDNGAINYQRSLAENILQFQQISMQQSNNQQQQGQQGVAHSPAPLNFFLGHPASGHSYSPGPQIMYAQAAAAPMTQQQLAKQQGQHYNQNNASSGMVNNEEYYNRAASSSSAKDGQYMYRMPSGQPQQVQSSSAGQQQQGANKQQARTNNNMYNNNQQGQQRPFQ